MRILTWNINSVKTLPQYHPWNTFKTHQAILDHLDADIICFQEMKITRQALAKSVAVPDDYTSFFSFPLSKGGYSGVATYTHRYIPTKAEEGLTGILQPKPPFVSDERISRIYPEGEKDLDSEGRALVLDFSLFVLINVYCPNDGTEKEDRIKFKMDFHRLLKERVEILINEGREVIVVGDLNACAAIVDHCEGHLMVARGKAEGMEGEDGFYMGHESRPWLHSWLVPNGGPLVDAVREQWPDRQGMFTCWNTKISARASNYGTRIDYILITPGLKPWVKAADIQPELKGSDHCPVYLDLHDEIMHQDGSSVRLCDVISTGVPPRLAAQFWDEYKQHNLENFFGKKALQKTTSQESSSSYSSAAILPTQLSASSIDTQNVSFGSSQGTTSSKRKADLTLSASTSSKKAKVESKESGQTNLKSFFAKSEPKNNVHDLDADYRLALSLSEETTIIASAKTPQTSKWKSILAPLDPPLCTIHNEPAKELTVTKPGANKGKQFWICSRPVGPGYDKGKNERLRAEVDPQYKCNFFKWSSQVRREMNQKVQEKSTSS